VPPSVIRRAQNPTTLSYQAQVGTKRRPESRYLPIWEKASETQNSSDDLKLGVRSSVFPKVVRRGTSVSIRLTAESGLTEDLLLNSRLQKLQGFLVGIKTGHNTLRYREIIGIVTDIHAHHGGNSKWTDMLL